MAARRRTDVGEPRPHGGAVESVLGPERSVRGEQLARAAGTGTGNGGRGGGSGGGSGGPGGLRGRGGRGRRGGGGLLLGASAGVRALGSLWSVSSDEKNLM